jgi:predicted AlkP superfamily pyrophosphatase or phosphodiesterase
MMRRLSCAVALAAALLATSHAAGLRYRPRLLVVLSVDQFRGDYVTLYGHQWSRGLRRLVDGGARFTQAAYPYFTTVTCAGHATIGTGTFPATHGLPANSWLDRPTGKTVSCTDDPGTSIVSYGRPSTAPGHSARTLRVPAFGDELRAQAAVRPHVVTLSIKPRSAIMMAGHGGDLVLWHNDGDGWASSTAFGTAPVPFIARYAADHPVARDSGATWTRLLPGSAYRFTDESRHEHPPDGWSSAFPHALPDVTKSPKEFYGLWEETPFADAALGRLAAEAVRGFGLGTAAGRTDYLGVSFSTLDYVGHDFGPHSHEVQDVLARLDVTIGLLLEVLDRRVGSGHYTVALTGDHGVAPLPEEAAEAGIDAGRMPNREIVDVASQALVSALGDGKHVLKLAYIDMYLAPGVVDRLRDTPGALRAVLDAIGAVRGVERVLVGDELPRRKGDADPLVRAAALNYVPGRSGDLIILPRAYWQNSSTGTTHGTAYAYDQRVPLVLFGAGVRPGTYDNPATPADIAPTLARLAGVTMARTDGRPLAEALTQPSPPAARGTRTGTPTAP